MPNSISAKKSLRQNHVRRARNREQRSILRGVMKKFRVAAADGSADEAETAFRAVVKKIDQAAAKNLIHKKTAARTKSRLSKLLAPGSSES